MKKFGVIFQYEIMNYIKNKSFMISTIVIAVLAAVILFLPSVFDMSGILGINKDDTDDTADNTEITDVIIICDEKDIFAGTGIVEGVLNDVKIENVSSRDALVDKIENDENVFSKYSCLGIDNRIKSIFNLCHIQIILLTIVILA